MFIVIPNLLISIQRDIEILNDEKNPNMIINTRPPQESSVYYENTTGQANGVYVSGDYAYVADGPSGLALIDVSDPTNPGTLVYEDTTGYAYGVYVSGDYAYVADSSSGLAVIQVRKRVDIEDPIISNAPSDFTVEVGYTGQILSWTAIDANPNYYTIALQPSAINEEPSKLVFGLWTSGNAINYRIPDGFAPGVYTYNITFTDESGNSISDTVTVTINSPGDDDEPPGGAIPFGNSFLIFIGFSVICLIFAKKRQIVRESR